MRWLSRSSRNLGKLIDGNMDAAELFAGEGAAHDHVDIGAVEAGEQQGIDGGNEGVARVEDPSHPRTFTFSITFSITLLAAIAMAGFSSPCRHAVCQDLWVWAGACALAQETMPRVSLAPAR